MGYSLCVKADAAAGKEWLITNGLGGYASGMILGPPQRRHDGILVAALDAPWGRMVMLDRIDETIDLEEGARPLFDLFAEFRLDLGLPVWRFVGAGREIERRLVMPHGQNSSWVQYRLIKGDPARLTLRPWFDMRGNDGWLDQPLRQPRGLSVEGRRIEVRMGAVPPLRLHLAPGPTVILDGARIEPTFRRIEAERYYPPEAPLWSPATLAVRLDSAGASLLASTENWPTALAMDADQAWETEQSRRRALIDDAHPALRGGAAAQMVLAADAFVFTPQGRPELAARARAEGAEIRSVIAGYPWFNDWGRDTMISLEGLTLVTGRHRDARQILGTFAHYIQDGLIPSNVPDGRTAGVYHAADATLWFFHAIDRYVAHSRDHEFLASVLPKLVDIMDHHRKGTRFGIAMDPADGLLGQGDPAYMLTWMDSATPRRGKAVEINALWYNALCLLSNWLAGGGDRSGADAARTDADRVHASFNRRFWNPATGYLFDLIDGETGTVDPACRPNQIFAVSLPHPVLAQAHWAGVVEAVRRDLLTPVGLRSLSPQAADYQPRYVGDLAARDFAYHRGTVWPWLIGPFIDAWLRVYPERGAEAGDMLADLASRLGSYSVGTLAEVFDGDPPFEPRGCTAQAWSVAEWLRARVAVWTYADGR